MNIGTIGGLIIIALIIAYCIFGYKYYKKNKIDEEDIELHKLHTFFNSIREAVETAMIEYLSHIDIHNITNINDMQKQVLNDLYDTVWNICIDKLHEDLDPDTSKLLKLLLTREVVESFIQEIYNSSIEVQETVTAKYNDAVLSAANKN